MFSAEPVSYNVLSDLSFTARFLWKDGFCYIWETFRTVVNCEVSVIHVMVKWYFCARPAWLWFVIKVLMQHHPHITENGKNNLKILKCFTISASIIHAVLSAVTGLFGGVYEMLCPLLDALSSLFAVRQWRHCCLASYPFVEEMRGPDGGWWRWHQACQRQY